MSGAHRGDQTPQQGGAGQILKRHGLTIAIRERHSSVGVLLIGAGLILRTSITHKIRQRDSDETSR